jgi:hypothetical protein
MLAKCSKPAEAQALRENTFSYFARASKGLLLNKPLKTGVRLGDFPKGEKKNWWRPERLSPEN